RDGDAQQRRVVAGRAAAIRLVGLLHRALGEDGAEGVELGVQRLDARECQLGELARRGIAPAHELDLSHYPCESSLGVEHRGTLSERSALLVARLVAATALVVRGRRRRRDGPLAIALAVEP